MIYLVKETTDRKYVGIRIELDSLPKIGDIFILKGIEVKVTYVYQGERIKIYSENYIIVLVEDK